VLQPGRYVLLFTCNVIFYCESSLLFSEKIASEFFAFRLALDIAGGNETGNVILWSQHGGDNQRWHFDDDLTIRSELGFVMDVTRRSTDSGTPIIAYRHHGDDNQRFRIVPISK